MSLDSLHQIGEKKKLLTDRNGTAVILHEVHSINQIIETTEIIRYHGTEYRHEEMGLTETIL